MMGSTSIPYVMGRHGGGEEAAGPGHRPLIVIPAVGR